MSTAGDTLHLKLIERNGPDYRALFESAPGLFLVLTPDPSFTIIAVSNAYARASMTPPQEILGRSFFEVFPDNAPDDRASLEHVLKTREPERMPTRRYSLRRSGGEREEFGARYWSRLNTPVLHSSGELLAIIHQIEDVTEGEGQRLHGVEQDALLQFQERRFQLMIDSVKDYAIFMLNPEGRIATWNEGAKRLKGYEASEIIGQHFSKFYPPEDLAWDKPAFELREARKIGRFEDEGWRLRKDGTRFWANVVITAIRGRDGILLGFTKVTRDLTERRRNEEARIEEQRQAAVLTQVQENEKILDQIFSQSPSFMALLSVPDYRFLKSNSAHVKLIGRAEILGRKIAEVAPELEDQGILRLLDDVVKTGRSFVGKEKAIRFESSLDNRYGSRTIYLDFVYQPLRRANGEIYAIASQGYDVTDRVRSRRAVENERENFRNLFKQTPEMVCILRGPDHIFEFVNEAHVRALGFNATGMAIRDAQPESVEVHGILDDVYQTGKTAELYEMPVTVTDRLRYFNLTYSARRDEEGKIDGIMVLGVEITEQRKAAQDLIRAKQEAERAVQARDEFLSIASHELKTPLTSLNLQVQMRKRSLVLGRVANFAPERLRTLLDDDAKQIARLVHLVDDMLDISRLNSGKFELHREQTDLFQLVQEVVERFKPQLQNASVELTVETDGVVTGNWDRYRLEQVFVNLLTNAMKYGRGKAVHVNISSGDGKVRLAIRDEGIGIAEVDRERIFKQFERAVSPTGVSGLGLGLYIVRTIVEAHRGTIRVNSEVGKGSTFVVELPLG